MSTVGGAASDLERRLAALSPAQRKLLELRLAKRRQAAEPAARPSGIPRVPEAASYPLSVDQERIYFIHQLTPDSPFYNIYDVGRMRGALDHAVLLAALREVVRRHEILRTRFLTLDGEPRQVVEPHLDVVLGEVDLRGLPAERIRAETDRQVAALLQRPFDLAELPLCRSMIFRLAEDERVWPMVFHHIVTDWISNFAVRGELVALYSALVEGRPSPLPELPCQYRDYSVWQRQQLESEALARQAAFWREHLRDAPHDTELPLDRPRPRIPNAVGARHPLALSTRDSDRLRQLAQRRGATLFMSFVALFKVLVLRMTGQERLIVGSPMVSRNHPDLEHLLGFFLHQLVFYTDLGGDPGFGEALGRVRKSTVGAFSNKDVPFGQVVELVGPERDLGRMPLTQLNFLFLNPHQIDPGLFPGVEYLPYRFDGESSKFDVTFVVWDHGDRMDGLVEYDVGLFDRTTISRLIRGYQNLLAAVVDDPDRPLSQLSLLAPAERHQLAVEWNGPGWGASRVPSWLDEPEGVVAALFRNAAEQPEAVALRWRETAIDYKSLATAVGGLAAQLEAAGVRPEVVVGVWIDRRPEMLVALLAIWAAGGAYLPLDPTYPEERVAFMVEDSGAELVLVASSCQAARTHPVPSPPSPLSRGRERGDQNPQTSSRQGQHNLASDFSHSRPTLEVPPLASIPAPPADWRPRQIDGDALAYLIYTSGSTGRPKGVAIRRRSVDLCVATLLAELPAESWRGVLASTSISFDVSVAELFPPLVAGGTVVLADNVLALSTLTEREAVRMVSTVPSAMAALLHQGPLPPTVTTVVLAGEPLRRAVADAVFDAVFEDGAEGLRLFDLYGPTEDTVYATGAEVMREPGEPTIGRPLAPGRSHAVDRRGRLAALGAEAELWLGGPGLARGYHRRPGLTAERFVPDPWGEEPGARLYRTGDRVRHRVDGELDHLGRLDHQVKVRGFRVELGEIENALEQQPGVAQAVVLALGSAGSDGRRLVAHVAGADLDPGTLRRALETRLPAHLVPSALRVVESLPVLPNGKVDRKGLSRIVVGGEDSVGQATPPRTALEEILLAIYREVLGLGDAPIGVESSFFALGGHSLLAVQVAARLRERLSVELPMRTLFEAPTVAALAARVETLQGVDDEAPPLTVRTAGPGSPAPLAYAQERLWFLDRLVPEDPSYNMPAVLELRGELDVVALSAALAAVVARHEALRTRFVEVGARVEQRIDPPSLHGAMLPLVDLEALPADRRESTASALGRRIAARPFDLARGPIWRAHLVRLGNADHQLHLVVHHIVADAWSQGLWVRELGEVYRSVLDTTTLDRTAGDRGDMLALSLGPAPLQLADVAVWQRQWLQGEALDRRIDFWRQRLAEAPVLELPSDRPRRALALRRGRTRTVRLDGELHSALRSLAAGRGATLFMVLLAGYATLLTRLAGQREVVVGTPVAGRRRRALEDVFGFFVNTLALRCDLRSDDPQGSPGFGELVARLREVTLAADAQQDVPFEKVVAGLDPERSLTTTPLVQAMLVLQNLPPVPLELPGLTLEARPIDSGTAKFDLTLMLTEMPDGSLEGLVESDLELFDATTIERWWRSFETLLRHAVAEPETPVDRLDLLAAAERQQVLWEWTSWTGGEGVESIQRSIPEAVAHWARHDPAAIAVEGEGADGAWTQLTYGELVSRSRGLADRLVALGVQRGERVGVCAERTVDLVVALLGVLEVGAAYLPLDPTLPRERLSFQLANAGSRWVVAPAGLEDRLGGDAGRLWLEDSSSATEVAPATTRVTAEDLAYVIYTSGSTGRPKGVLVPHGHVGALMEATAPWFDFGPDDVWSCFHSHGFDFSVWEIWGCLTTGGRLVMVPYWTSRSPADYRRLLAERGVTVVSQTPSAFRQLLTTDLDGSARVPSSVRVVVLGGEAFEPSTTPTWFEHCAAQGAKAPELINLYGITETTVHVTVRPITAADPNGAINSPVGLAIPDQRVRLLDRRGRPVSPGSSGEIHVGGGRLAWGYLGRPGLTAERFVPDAWGAPGSRCYRSGDLARQRTSGELDFLGRIDHQVKVRGFRIELGEIEAALVSQPEVGEAVVLPRGQGLDVELVAFVVSAGDPVSPLDLRDRLRSHLPDSMVPAAIVAVEALPLTANGKLDRRALARLEVDPGEASGDAWIAPRTPTEALVAEVFAEVLAVDRVGAEADFFRLGGHSLLATQVVSRLAERLDTPIRLRQLFEHRTVASLAAVLPPPSAMSELEPRPVEGRGRPRARSAATGTRSEAVAGSTGGSRSPASEHRAQGNAAADTRRGVVPQATQEDPQVAPLSFAQERLFILDRLEPGNPAYHMPFALRFRGRLDTVALERCWKLLLARHALLRVTFGLDDGRPVQRLGSVDARPWPWIDLRSLPDQRREAELERLGRWQAHAPFDLATGPVIRALGVRLAATDHALLFNLHHIAGDGWSVAVLTRELGVLYRAWVEGRWGDGELVAELPTLPLDPLDHARRQRRWLEGPKCAQQVDYWRAQLDDLPTLDLPTDHPRPTVRRFRPGRQTLTLDGELSAALGRLAEDSGATPFMVLLTGFVVLLGRLAGQHDVAVGTPVAGRSRRDVEGLVGIFLNTLVLRSDLSGGPSFGEALARTRERVLDALDRQDVPFERLLDTLGVERDLSRTPLFQVFFNMLNLPVADLELGEGHLEALEMPDLGAKFDLTLYADDRRPRWRFELIYDRGLFGEARMALLLAQLEEVYRQAVASPERSITTFDLRSVEGTHAPALPDPGQPLDTTWRGPVHRWVAERVAESPDRIAVESPEGRWTYGELMAQSHRLAHALAAAGLRPGEPVAIVAHRSASLVWAVFGTLAAGGVFVLLDPAYPAGRQIAILRKAGPAALLRLRAAGPLAAGVAAVVDELDLRLDLELAPWSEAAQGGPLANQPTTAPEVELGPDDPAALGFTSGSTGEPKGIVGRHGPLTHFLPWQCETFELRRDDRYSLLSGLAHDPIQRDLFTSLATGATLCLPEPDTLLVPGALATWMATAGITVAHLTPAMAQVVASGGDAGGDGGPVASALRRVFLTGDALTPRDVAGLERLAPGVRCFNFYGSTETQRAVGFSEATSPDEVTGGVTEAALRRVLPLGRGMEGAQLLVVTAAGTLAGVGELGEIWVRSPHLARGYLGAPRATAERFAGNPWGAGEAWDRVYRTGDLGRYRPDGQVEFAGRADQQVQIRGVRVELGEIETRLLDVTGVAGAVVLAEGEPGSQRLAAAVVAEPGAEPEIEALRRSLRRELPEALVPTAWVVLDALPMTPNGKLDRRALIRQMESTGPATVRGTGPQGELEETLAGVFSEVLGVSGFGRDDNFFDLGGNSLLLVRAHEWIEQRLDRSIPALALFQFPTVRTLADHLARQADGAAASAPIERRPRQLQEGQNRQADLRRRRLRGRSRS